MGASGQDVQWDAPRLEIKTTCRSPVMEALFAELDVLAARCSDWGWKQARVAQNELLLQCLERGYELWQDLGQLRSCDLMLTNTVDTYNNKSEYDTQPKHTRPVRAVTKAVDISRNQTENALGPGRAIRAMGSLFGSAN